MALTPESRKALAGMVPETLADAPELVAKLKAMQKSAGPNEGIAIASLLACLPDEPAADVDAESNEPQPKPEPGAAGRAEALRRFPQLAANSARPNPPAYR